MAISENAIYNMATDVLKSLQVIDIVGFLHSQGYDDEEIRHYAYGHQKAERNQVVTAKATYFVKRLTPFAAPRAGQPDPCGVEIFSYSATLGRYALAGCMHLAHARDLHGDCEIREQNRTFTDGVADTA